MCVMDLPALQTQCAVCTRGGSIDISVLYRHFIYIMFSIYQYRITDKLNISNSSIFYLTFSDFLTLI